MGKKISQGVTTVVVGNCGVSLAPLTLPAAPPPPLDLIGDAGEFRFATLRRLRRARSTRQPPAVNAACLVGHSTLRVGAMDRLDRAGDARRDRRRCRRGWRRRCDAGAIGLSTGLDYPPAQQRRPSEVVALAACRRTRTARIHTTHMRNEGDHVIDAIDEAFAIGREAECRW